MTASRKERAETGAKGPSRIRTAGAHARPLPYPSNELLTLFSARRLRLAVLATLLSARPYSSSNDGIVSFP